MSNLYLGFILFMGYVEICLANTLSPNGTNSFDGFWPCSLSNGVLQSRHGWLLDKMLLCAFRQPRQDWRVFSEFFLRAALNVTLDCSDDSTE